ncbi:MAG TPA: hypothetical protein VIM61_09285 [Chthoniobacterales bacterium]
MKTETLKPGRRRTIVDPRRLDLVDWLRHEKSGEYVAKQVQIESATGINQGVLSKLLRKCGEDDPTIEIAGSLYATRSGLTRRIKAHNEGH